MLNRLSFSCLDAIFDVTSSLGDIRTIVDPRALIKIALFASLFPWLEADLTREWQDHIVASDASGSFGF